jgi:hypothetical protein
LEAIDRYRTTLSLKNKETFDTAWGIDIVDVQAQAKLSRDANDYDDHSVWESLRMLKFNALMTRPVRNPLLEDLRRVRREANREIGAMYRLPPDQQGKHLLSLFQQDLLSSVNFNIINQGTKAAGTRVGLAETPLSPIVKVAAWIFVIVFNCTLLLYVLLFAISQTESRQSAWLKTFIMWLIMEIFVVSTLCMVLSRIVIPSFIMSEAGRVKESMLHVIEKYQAKVIAAAAADENSFSNAVVNNNYEDSEFSASNYLFVSTRIAKSFPNLKASSIVQEFKTPLPQRPYGVGEKDATRAYRMKLRITALVNSMSVLLMVLLGYLSSLPAPLHDMLLNALNWCFFGYITLLHTALYKENPSYVLIPAAILVLIFAPFMYYQSKGITKLQRIGLKQQRNPIGFKKRPTRDLHSEEKEEEVRLTVHDEEEIAVVPDARAAAIVQHMRDLVKANVATMGDVSGSDDSGEEEVLEYRLAEILRKPGVMDRLFELSSDENEDGHTVRIEIRNASDSQVPSDRQRFTRPKVHTRSSSYASSAKDAAYDMFDISDDDDESLSSRPAAADTRAADIVQHMRHLVEENIVHMGDLSSSETGDTPPKQQYRWAEILRREGVMAKLLDLSDDEDGDESARKSIEQQRADSPGLIDMNSSGDNESIGEVHWEMDESSENQEEDEGGGGGAEMGTDTNSQQSSRRSSLESEEELGDRAVRVMATRSQVSPKADQLLSLHKRYMFSYTGKMMSMEYRENEARDRLEKRLNSKRSEKQEGEVGRPSMVSKELSKRLAANSARHRLSIMESETQAKGRLQLRLALKNYMQEKNDK